MDRTPNIVAKAVHSSESKNSTVPYGFGISCVSNASVPLDCSTVVVAPKPQLQSTQLNLRIGRLRLLKSPSPPFRKRRIPRVVQYPYSIVTKPNRFTLRLPAISSGNNAVDVSHFDTRTTANNTPCTRRHTSSRFARTVGEFCDIRDVMGIVFFSFGFRRYPFTGETRRRFRGAETCWKRFVFIDRKSRLRTASRWLAQNVMFCSLVARRQVSIINVVSVRQPRRIVTRVFRWQNGVPERAFLRRFAALSSAHARANYFYFKP